MILRTKSPPANLLHVFAASLRILHVKIATADLYGQTDIQILAASFSGTHHLLLSVVDLGYVTITLWLYIFRLFSVFFIILLSSYKSSPLFLCLKLYSIEPSSKLSKFCQTGSFDSNKPTPVMNSAPYPSSNRLISLLIFQILPLLEQVLMEQEIRSVWPWRANSPQEHTFYCQNPHIPQTPQTESQDWGSTRFCCLYSLAVERDYAVALPPIPKTFWPPCISDASALLLYQLKQFLPETQSSVTDVLRNTDQQYNFSIKIKLLYRYMADSDRKHRLNKDTVGDHQTIFDFLKRKKQVNLEHSVNKSLHLHSHTKHKNEMDIEDDLQHTRDLPKHYTHDMSSKYGRTAKPQSITPRKILFEDRQKVAEYVQPKTVYAKAGEQQNRKGKSFLAMISPVKNRPSSALQERQQSKENHYKYQNKPVVKGSKSDNFVRRNLTKSINTLKETINQLSQNLNTIKDKSHGLAVLFNPIFNYLAEGSQPVSRQVGELKNKLKSFEALIQGVSIQSCDNELQIFHRNLEQHLQTQEEEIRKQAQRSKYQEVSGLKNEKQVLVQKLQTQLKKVLKENDLLSRKIQKIESSKGQIQQAVSQRQINYVEQIQRIKNNYEANIQQLASKNEELLAKLKNNAQQLKYLEKEHKSEKMLRQSIESKLREEIQQITQAKDAYLLNQIMVLKAEFNTDLSRINELHKIKQAELLSRIERKEEQQNQRKFQSSCNKQIQTKIIEEANLIKQENLHLKTQADCIITDMYRMNEQLYQHWIALKDIKVLSTRLGSFSQYRQIYQDLSFNEHLFH